MSDGEARAQNGGSALERLAGKYLTFSLENETYAIEILKVHEIIGVLPITKVPNTSESIKGVINLRGRIIPVVDLRLQIGLSDIRMDERTCITVVEINNKDKQMAIGVIVDTVLEVLNITSKELRTAPDYGGTIDTNFIPAMIELSESNVITIVDIDKLLGDTCLQSLDQDFDGMSV